MKKDFLSILDLTYEEIFEIFDLTKDLKEKTRKREPNHLLKGYTLKGEQLGEQMSNLMFYSFKSKE